MSWNPDTYNKFKSERFAPFYDLIDLLKIKPEMDVVDLGCGTGELTRKLADLLPEAKVLGIDSSIEMLKDSKNFENDKTKFKHQSIEEQLNLVTKWDLIFSNASIQWIDDHETLLPKIIASLKPNSQLLIQLPAQRHNATNKMLHQLADEEPFHTALNDWKRISPVLDIERYAQIFFENGSKSMTAYEKIYPLILPDCGALFDWTSGTALTPYIEKLHGENRQLFIAEFKKRLQQKFATTPVFYPFKRIVLEATF